DALHDGQPEPGPCSAGAGAPTGKGLSDRFDFVRGYARPTVQYGHSGATVTHVHRNLYIAVTVAKGVFYEVVHGPDDRVAMDCDHARLGWVEDYGVRASAMSFNTVQHRLVEIRVHEVTCILPSGVIQELIRHCRHFRGTALHALNQLRIGPAAQQLDRKTHLG